jgi:rhamnosyltransferase
MHKKPVVHVLLALFNGEKYIPEQLESLCQQDGVSVLLHVTDDGSTDKTAALVNSYSGRLNIQWVQKPNSLRRGASVSFLHLLRSVNVAADEYLAFCDQDDIWLPGKLKQAIECLERTGCVGYSCSVEAFWPTGSTSVLTQSRRFTDIDYFYEGAGQGCTFVFKPELQIRVLDVISKSNDLLDRVHYHDWLVYAVCRSLGMRWHIDPAAFLKYRQHASNDTGARLSFSGLARRLRLVRSGWYADQVASIRAVLSFAGIAGDGKEFNDLGRARRALILLRTGRRRFSDRLVLFLSVILGLL